MDFDVFAVEKALGIECSMIPKKDYKHFPYAIQEISEGKKIKTIARAKTAHYANVICNALYELREEMPATSEMDYRAVRICRGDRHHINEGEKR